jgi:hypothetical protein
MQQSSRVIYAIFLAFFSIILGIGLVFHFAEPVMIAIGSLIAAAGATFFFIFFLTK